MDKKEFPRRRKRFMDLMGEDSIAIIPTSRIHIRNRDVEYRFRPDSDFYYLTGFSEPEAVAVFMPSRTQGEFLLFCRERDPEMELWNGSRAGLEGACDDYGADDAFPISDIDDILPGLMENKERIFYNIGNDKEFDQKVTSWMNRVRQRSRTGVHAPEEIITPNHFLHELRLFKSRSEIKVMRQAARISAKAHIRAMQVCQPGMMEYQIESELNHEFMQHGAQATAYPAIVGGGANSCVLHYIDNNCVLNDGDMLLIDAGCELENYASDITRTFPINGQFTEEQRIIYEIVLEAQYAAIEQAYPGNHWNSPHEAAVRTMTQGLVKAGLLKGRLPKLIKDQSYAKYFMHRTGHWLGMDVHDVGDYKLEGDWRSLEPGMVLTIEPGLYLPAGTRGLAKKWWNIGVRIEDDVLITASGNDVLSKDAPKTVEEIEDLMQQAEVA